MEPADAAEAAARLLAARRACEPLAALPGALLPATPEDGYLVQTALERSWAAPGAGYKIGASSEKAQALLGVQEPFAGRVFQDTLFESPAELPAAGYLFRLVEPEFAFRLSADLPAQPDGYGAAAVAEAVATLHPAIEVVSSAFGPRWTDVGGAALIADNGAHGALVLGPACSEWRGLDLAGHAVSLTVNGAAAGSGQGANALGGPLIALTWLVNHLSLRGRGLAAGEVVTTGLVTEFAYLEAGDRACADFGTLGSVEVRIGA